MKQLATKLAAALALLCTVPTRAGVSVPPKVIFNGSEQEVTINLTNEATHPSLVKVWIDDGNEDTPPEELSAPFLLTPSLFRLEPNTSRRVRILHLPGDEPLPTDRETRFYLNVLDVPPNPTNNDASTLLLAVHYRLRLVYRPSALATGKAGDSDQNKAHAQLIHWSLHHGIDNSWTLHAHNPAPYYQFFRSIHLTQTDQDLPLDLGKDTDLAPFSKRMFALPANWTPQTGMQVKFRIADDEAQDAFLEARPEIGEN